MPASANPTFSGPYDHEFDPPEFGATDGVDDRIFDSYAPLASP